MTLRQRLARAGQLELQAADLRRKIRAHACRSEHEGSLCPGCSELWHRAQAMEERARRLTWGRPLGESW